MPCAQCGVSSLSSSSTWPPCRSSPRRSTIRRGRFLRRTGCSPTIESAPFLRAPLSGWFKGNQRGEACFLIFCSSGDPPVLIHAWSKGTSRFKPLSNWGVTTELPRVTRDARRRGVLAVPVSSEETEIPIHLAAVVRHEVVSRNIEPHVLGSPPIRDPDPIIETDCIAI